MKEARAKRALVVVVLSICSQLGSRVAADAPPGRYTVAAETVRDNRTGLVWQKTVEANTQDNASAAAYCPTLTLDGVTNFRLPTMEELQSLVDFTRTSPAMDTKAFPAAPPDSFWSSTPYVGGSEGSFWYLNFKDGTMAGSTSSGLFRVRCVH
jgi:hypothetical protein